MAVDAGTIVDLVDASGLRGRGGAGFPAGRKWRTVIANSSPEMPPTVVVNAAEGEPGRSRTVRSSAPTPYHVIEGALIAAHAVGADAVIVAIKRRSPAWCAASRAAIAEIDAAGLDAAVSRHAVRGPDEYLYGEETALLETIDGRSPFPRIAPPYRGGVDEMVEHEPTTSTPAAAPPRTSRWPGPTAESIAPPTLAGNVETFANVPGIVRDGADWFREGTDESPGTIVCTVTGDTVRAGVAEIAMGTPLREVIERIGGGARPGREIAAVMSGVANPLVPAPRSTRR